MGPVCLLVVNLQVLHHLKLGVSRGCRVTLGTERGRGVIIVTCCQPSEAKTASLGDERAPPGVGIIEYRTHFAAFGELDMTLERRFVVGLSVIRDSRIHTMKACP